jgi:anthranilate synthase component II
MPIKKPLKILIIDNYDSFTYNLFHIVPKDIPTTIIRNDQMTLDQIRSENYSHIIISPGPGSPDDLAYFGVCGSVILDLGQTIPVLGICLGMQGICHCFGGKVVRAKNKMHGKTSLIKHNSIGIFHNIPTPIMVMRYHSLVAEESSLPDCLEIVAKSCDDGEIMGLKHKTLPIYGVQFHPESFATEFGSELINNFLKL